MSIEELKKLLPPARPAYTDEDLRGFSVNDLYRMKLTSDETARLRAINERRREDIERNAVILTELERPLAEELKAAGFDVESAWDLFNRKEPWNKRERIKPYAEALPILLKHLGRDYPPAVREGIARAMAMPQSRFAWHDLVRFYRDEKPNRAKDGLAVAVAAAADASVLDELIALAKDRKQGGSRLLLLSALARSTEPKARAALMELGTDPELEKEVQIILKRLRSKRTKVARPKQ
jgi:hypothetical protein